MSLKEKIQEFADWLEARANDDENNFRKKGWEYTAESRRIKEEFERRGLLASVNDVIKQIQTIMKQLRAESIQYRLSSSYLSDIEKKVLAVLEGDGKEKEP